MKVLRPAQVSCPARHPVPYLWHVRHCAMRSRRLLSRARVRLFKGPNAQSDADGRPVHDWRRPFYHTLPGECLARQVQSRFSIAPNLPRPGRLVSHN